MLLALCLKIYGCDRAILTSLATYLAALPQTDKKCFAVHHLFAVRCVERARARYLAGRDGRRGEGEQPSPLVLPRCLIRASSPSPDTVPNAGSPRVVDYLANQGPSDGSDRTFSTTESVRGHLDGKWALPATPQYTPRASGLPDPLSLDPTTPATPELPDPVAAGDAPKGTLDIPRALIERHQWI